MQLKTRLVQVRSCEKCGVSKKKKMRLPTVLLPSIVSVVDVFGDGNCGYRALAVSLGRPEDDLKLVRTELYHEIAGRREFYERQSQEHIDDLQNCVDHLLTEESPVGIDHWMRMPQLGDAIANTYQRPVHFYPVSGTSMTFLSSWVPPNGLSPLCFAFVNGNHFVSLTLQLEVPAAPVAAYWRRFTPTAALKWEEKIQCKLSKWENRQKSTSTHPPVTI
ncbi:hypothetical protein PsorP6_006342 [Peronosclerospora sorghi]|uniref:Uncharacterized protein n=1 Tax=Peronosclerospora sorghi TaxID=230839 RepID=A0ACC0W4N4_9STRA|nr:hypothetical protein PsorP6_006342 [Peronosclerospora sorghi]